MRRSKFSLSNYKLATFDMGELVPVGLTEILPGDTIQQATSALLRFSPLLAPVMHPINVRIHHWFVPHRLIWANGIDDSWEAFITGGHDGLDASVFPTITVNSGSGFALGSLADYLGVPTGVDDLPCSALPFRGYALIFNEFYRDQDLETALTIDTTGGPDTTTNQTLQTVSWEKDYFTSARPWTQKGTEVVLPLGTDAPVVTTATKFTVTGGGVTDDDVQGTNVTASRFTSQTPFTSASDLVHGSLTGLEADLTNATAANINEIRTAFALQRYKEARAKYGSRYTEYLAYCGVRSSDSRLQRPEYLGGGSQTMQISEILQHSPDATSGTTGSAGVGKLKGHGIGALRSNRYRKYFEEHGYIHTFISVRPKTMYANGLPRHWSKTTKEDFFQKELQGIGQQEVYNKELYWADTGPNDIFGYQDRYDDYRRAESSISGEFRSSAANFWHLARIFAADVTLNSSFIKCTPSNRIFATTSVDQLNCMINHNIQARRMVSNKAPSYSL